MSLSSDGKKKFNERTKSILTNFGVALKPDKKFIDTINDKSVKYIQPSLTLVWAFFFID